MAYIADAVRTSYIKVLYRGSVPELLQLYHMSHIVYSTSILDLIYPVGAIAIGAKPSIGTWERIQGRFLWASNTEHPAGNTGGSETVALGDANLPFSAIVDKQSNTGGWGAQFVTVPSGNYMMGSKGTNATPHENMPPYLSVDILALASRYVKHLANGYYRRDLKHGHRAVLYLHLLHLSQTVNGNYLPLG